MFPHLMAILPDLKAHFERAYLCPPPSTLQQKDHIAQLQADPFFTIFTLEADLQIGERFAYLYLRAAEAAQPDQPLHLCFLDRLAFALETGYRDSFLADVSCLTADDLPLIFQRSEQAWKTHPQNYRAIETFVTVVGKRLFNRDLDYAWCHMVITAGELRRIMPLVHNTDLSMVAEMAFHIQDRVHSRDVDWLAWEDPFMLSRPAEELKHEREESGAESEKRLAYALRMSETLTLLAGEHPAHAAAAES